MIAKIRKCALWLKGQSLKFNEWVIIFGYVLIWLYAGTVTGIKGSYMLAGSFTLLLIFYLLWLRPKIRWLSWKSCYFLPQPFVSPLIGLSGGEQYEFGLGNT